MINSYCTKVSLVSVIPFAILLLAPAKAAAQRVALDEVKVLTNASSYARVNTTNPELGDLIVVPCKANPRETIVVAAYLYYGPDNLTAEFASLKPALAVKGPYKSGYAELAGAAKADASYYRPDDRVGTDKCAFALFLPYSQVAQEAVGISGYYSYRVIVFRRESNGELTVLQDVNSIGGIRQQAITPYEYAGALYRRVIGVAN